MKTYEFRIFEGHTILWAACGNALFWALLLAFAAMIPGEIMILAVGLMALTLVGTTVYIFFQLNLRCRFTVYPDKIEQFYLSKPFGRKKTDRTINFSEILSYYFNHSNDGDMVLLKLNNNRGWLSLNRSQFSKGSEVFKEFVVALEEAIKNFNIDKIAENNEKQVITKGKGFFKSTGGKIFLMVLILLTIGFTIFIFAFSKDMRWIQYVKLFVIYMIVFPLAYRSFFQK